MNKENASKLREVLVSGKYKRARLSLHDFEEGTDCCIGVAATEFMPNYIRTSIGRVMNNEDVYNWFEKWIEHPAKDFYRANDHVKHGDGFQYTGAVELIEQHL